MFGAESAIPPDSLQRAGALGLLHRLLAMDVSCCFYVRSVETGTIPTTTQEKQQVYMLDCSRRRHPHSMFLCIPSSNPPVLSEHVARKRKLCNPHKLVRIQREPVNKVSAVDPTNICILFHTTVRSCPRRVRNVAELYCPHLKYSEHGVETSILRRLIQVPFDNVLQAYAAWPFILLDCILIVQGKCGVQLFRTSEFPNRAYFPVCYPWEFLHRFVNFASFCIKFLNIVFSESDVHEVRELQNSFFDTRDTEMFTDHVENVSSSKKSIVLLVLLLLQVDFFSKFEFTNMFFRAVAILASGVSKLGYCFPVIQGYRNTRNKSISQFQEYRLRYHASVEDDTKRVQSALCTRMRIVFSSIRLGPKTSV